MILIRDVFRLKFGKAREALAAWKNMNTLIQQSGHAPQSMRVLTDLVGPYYTFVFETTAPDLATYESESRKMMADKNWRAAYDPFMPLVESGYREIFTIVQ
jgi:hypothetical protein